MLEFVTAIVGESLHAKRVASLADAATGAMRAATLGITAMAHGLAAVVGLDPGHAAKQIDRLLGNSGLVLDDLFVPWVRWMVGGRELITVAIDWTEWDADDQATLSLNVVTDHGRAMPLMWRTISTKDKKVDRPQVERELVERLRDLVPESTDITIVGDRWFGSVDLYETCYEFGVDFICRFRSVIAVTDAKGVTKSAKEWLGEKRFLRIKDARVTGSQCHVAQVVLVHEKGMKEPWCLATSRGDLTGAKVKQSYGRRFTIEECFRDIKDLRFGFGLKQVRVGRADRRDRLLFIATLCLALVTLLGAASEKAGLDRAFSSKAQLHSCPDRRWPASCLAWRPWMRPS